MYLIISLIIVFLILTYWQQYEYFDDVLPTASLSNRKILILYAGGTIGMVNSPKGYIPKAGFLEEKLAHLVANNKSDVAEYTIKEYTPLIDSSNLSPADWNKMTADIRDNYRAYDAFIIIHGTDTMAYTASALAFLLENLGKPVVITGSMISLQEFRNDGDINLINSLLYASRYNIPEVVLCFDNQIIRGCRSKKVNANSVKAFASPNYPPLGIFGVDIEINRDIVLKGSGQSFGITTIKPGLKIIVVRLFPGIDGNYIRNIIANGGGDGSGGSINGIVLETFGIGDAPSDPDFIGALRDAIGKGIIIINCTQCLVGRVESSTYETGSEMTKIGVISGLDMTAEAALGKLYYLMSLTTNTTTLANLMSRNLRGELTTEPSTLFLSV